MYYYNLGPNKQQGLDVVNESRIRDFLNSNPAAEMLFNTTTCNKNSLATEVDADEG